jgi:hypothetical protein
MSSFNINNAIMGINIVPSGTNETISISSDNKVGIGISSPSGQLHVIGSGIFSGDLFVNDVPVSVSGHSHSSSNIIDFDSSVSGLLPITDIVAGTNISISTSGTVFTISASGTSGGGSGLTEEEVDDRVAALLVSGSGISLDYDDDANTLTIATTGLQPSGDYSVVGHTHSASEITDLNSSVSGLLPTISNSGDNRVLTSTGSSLGITAENNLTFNGSLLNVTGSGIFSSNLLLNNQTANTVASFDADKNIVSLSTTTHPTLTELSYVKGVTSSVQTQLNDKASIKSAYYIGTLFN